MRNSKQKIVQNEGFKDDSLHSQKMNRFTLKINDKDIEEQYQNKEKELLRHQVFLIALIFQLGFFINFISHIIAGMSTVEYVIDVSVNFSLLCVLIFNKVKCLRKYHHYAFLFNQIAMVSVTFYNVISEQNYQSQEYTPQFQYFYLGAILYGLVLGHTFLYRMSILFITTFLYIGLALSDSKNQKPVIAVVIISHLVLYLNKTYQGEKEKRLFFIANERVSFWNNIIQNVLPINMIVVKYDEEFSRIRLETSNQMAQKNLGILSDENLQDFLEKTKLEVQQKTSNSNNSESTIHTSVNNNNNNNNNTGYSSLVNQQQSQAIKNNQNYIKNSTILQQQQQENLFQFSPLHKLQSFSNQQSQSPSFSFRNNNNNFNNAQQPHQTIKQLNLKQLVKEEFLIKIKSSKNVNGSEKAKQSNQRNPTSNNDKYQIYNGEYQKSINSDCKKFGLRIYTFTMIGYYALICIENESYKERYSNSKTKFKVLKYLFRNTLTKSIQKLIIQNKMIDQFLTSFEAFKKRTNQKSKSNIQNLSNFNSNQEASTLQFNSQPPPIKSNNSEIQVSNNQSSMDQFPSSISFQNNQNYNQAIFSTDKGREQTSPDQTFIRDNYVKQQTNKNPYYFEQNSNKSNQSFVQLKPQEFLAQLKDQIEEIQLHFSNIMHLLEQRKRIEYSLSEFSLKNFCKKIESTFQNKLKRIGISLSFNIFNNSETVKDLLLKQDEKRLFQIISNLMQNAITFNTTSSPQNSRFIRLEFTQLTEEPNHINIKVINSSQLLTDGQVFYENTIYSDSNCIYLSTRNDLMLKSFQISHQFKIGLRTSRKLIKQIGPFDKILLHRSHDECEIKFSIYQNIEILKKDTNSISQYLEKQTGILSNFQNKNFNNSNSDTAQIHSERLLQSQRNNSKIFHKTQTLVNLDANKIQRIANKHEESSLASHEFIQEIRNLSEFNSVIELQNFKDKQKFFNDSNLFNLKKLVE